MVVKLSREFIYENKHKIVSNLQHVINIKIELDSRRSRVFFGTSGDVDPFEVTIIHLDMDNYRIEIYGKGTHDARNLWESFTYEKDIEGSELKATPFMFEIKPLRME